MHNGHRDTDSAEQWADRINEAYSGGMGESFGARARDRINWMCAQARGESVLDIGCSQGIASLLLAREGLRVTGIDISRAAIEYASRERDRELPSVQERIEFLCVDLAAMPAGKYDTVLMGEVIEHQTNPARFLSAATEFVAPGGKLVLTVPFGLHPWPDHKSIIYPADLVLGLPADFSISDLDVHDGYIRLVADSDASGSGPDWSAILRATRTGAVAVHEKYYEIAADLQRVSKRVATLEASLSEATEARASAEHGRAKAESSLLHELEALQAESAAQQAQLEEARAEASLLRGQLETAAAGLEEQQAMASEAAGENDAIRSELVALEQKLIDSEAKLQAFEQERTTLAGEVSELGRRLSETSEELARAQAQLVGQATVHEQLHQMATSERQGLEEQLRSLRSELAIAQYKRSGHYLHLESERDFSRKLQDRLRVLHEENQRYRSSIALAVGRAVLDMRSPRGLVAFPKALLRAFRIYRTRSDMMAPLAFPRRKGVTLPPAPDFSAAPASVPVAPARKASPVAAGSDASNALSIRGWKQEMSEGKLPVISIMDEFSRACFAPHANLIEPRPDNWKALILTHRPKFLFVESSWKGNYGCWQYRVANYAHPPGNELLEMVEECKRLKIPTVFWNKEDPVHFTNFIEKARHFDHIFTTAEEALPKYADRSVGRLDTLQFAAEESLHNPVGTSRRNERICFAGSFYANRFQERRDDQLMLLDAARAFDFDIFDRNHNPAAPGPSDFSFPPRFAANIKGSLPYAQMNEAYRRYRVFLNVNSVIDSPTMFSRRVFELLACGTPVVSTWSKGTEATFGNDLVWHVRNGEEAQEALATLMSDDREWTRRSLAGIRAVFGAHTYRHRFSQICTAIGIEPPSGGQFSRVIVAAEAFSAQEATILVDAFRRQVLASGMEKRLMLVCRGDFTVEAVDHATTPDEISVMRTEMPLASMLASAFAGGGMPLIAVMSPKGVYGRFYLQDLVNAARYSGAEVVGKPLGTDLVLQYRHSVQLQAGSLLIRSADASAENLARLMELPTTDGADAVPTFAADAANFLLAEELSLERIHAMLSDVEV